MTRPFGVDLFSGVGGMRLGFEQAGFDMMAAVEIDAVHAAAHRVNFPSCAVLAASVTEVSGTEIRSVSGIRAATGATLGNPDTNPDAYAKRSERAARKSG